MDPIDLINRAERAVPAAKYIWGVIGTAAALSIVYGLLSGHTQASIIIGLVLVFLGVVLWMVLSSISTESRYVQLAAGFLVWLVMLVLAIFILFTISAFATGLPCNWAELLGLRSACAVPATPDPRSDQTDVTPDSLLTVNDCPRIPPVEQATKPSRTPGDPNLYFWVPTDFRYTSNGFETSAGHWVRKGPNQKATYTQGHWDVSQNQCVWVRGKVNFD